MTLTKGAMTMIGMKNTLRFAVACAVVVAGAGVFRVAGGAQDGPPTVKGTITAVGEGTVTFQASPDKTVTVAVNEATVVKVGGKEAKLADLQVGMHAYAVVKEGQPASEIRAYMPKPTAPAAGPTPNVGGAITAIGADSITLQPKDGQAVTVSVNAATVYKVNGKAATLGDVKAGMDLKVGMRAYAFVKEGQPASEIRAYTPKPPAPPGDRTPVHKGVSGLVTAVGADSITLQPKEGQAVTVSVNAATVYKVNGKAATLGDVKAGMRCGALGDPGQPAREVHAYLPVPK
ncbi:MAG: DUF5666 domain-containing protein [Planctomycetota bacterium]|nr:DUF5666 domain-containing protein [Planctomycetota bacterium]